MNGVDAQPYAPVIHVVDFVAGAQAAAGIAVVIDVFRAFSAACYAFAAGARSIIPVAELEAALLIKQQHGDCLLVGERYGRPLPGFDHGNSPTELQAAALRGRTLIQTTHAGTQGLVHVNVAAQEVITGALVNAAAIVRYIRRHRFANVTLVRMGKQASERCAEDDACAELIAARLRGHEPNVRDITAQLRASPSAQRFFDPAQPWLPATDFELCTRVDCFDFVLRLDRSTTPCQLQQVTA
jgi:2-phosphosulfolactate phosphatase